MRDFLLALCSELGIQVNLSKSSLTPSQRQDYLGMMLQSSPLRAFPTQARVQKVLCLVDEFSSSRVHPLSLWRSLLGGMYSLSTLIPGSRLRMCALHHRLQVSRPQESPTEPVSWDDSCRRDLRWWSDPSHLVIGVDLALPHPELLLFTDASDAGWGASRLRPPVRLVVSRCLTLFDQPPRASGSLPCHQRISPSPSGQVGVSLHRQYVCSFLPLQGRGHSLIDPQLSGSGDPSPVRVQRSASAPPVCPGSPQRPCGLSQPRRPGPRFRVDSPHGCLPGSFPLLAGDGGFVHHLPQPLPPSLLFAHGGSPSGGSRCDDPIVGSSAGLCIPSFRPHPEGAFQSSRLRNLELTLVAPFWPLRPWFPDLLDLLVDVPVLLPQRQDLLRQPHFHQSHRSLLALGLTGFRIASDLRRFGFSARVARQLAFSRRPSTRMNYQYKWSTFRSWCHSRGHSVSRPSILKVADFLLYLRRSLNLSYPSIASYCSMLSAAFHFVLPELSSHPVLHDLRSFRIERPLPSSRFPSWDFLRVLSLLRESPFEPLESCSLRDHTRKALFLLFLATARRVGELQAVSSAVSSSGGDLFLTYLPEFRAKSESSSNPLPHSFRVKSLRDFVGSLPGELSLCPVRALQVYLRRTSYLSPRPRSLFVSPHSFLFSFQECFEFLSP